MKKLKALCGFIAISLGVMTMPLSAGIVNVPLVNNAWTFIGVPGFQNFGASSASSGTVWTETGGYTIIDGAGTLGGTDYTVAGLEVPTWDGNASDAVDSTTLAVIDDADAAYSNNQPRTPYNGAGLGSNIYGTVAVMAIGQNIDATVDARTSTTEHGGATLVALRVDARAYKSTTSPIRTMYIRSGDASVPDIKVYYQADQEGEGFKMQYQISTASNTLDWSNNTTYKGTFDKDYTYDNAAVLGEDFPVAVASTTAGAAGNQVKNILHAFDMDLTDNNLSSAGKNLIEPNQDNSLDWTNYGDAFVSDSNHDLRTALDGNLTMLWFDTATQQWRQIRASNYDSASGHTGNPDIEIATDIPTTTTGLNKGDLEEGRGYWVKLEPNAASSGISGFVLADDTATDINHSDYVGDGWNMLSFGDEYLSYSVTGMVLTANGVGGAGDINITDTYGAATLSFTGGAGLYQPATDSNLTCRYINRSIDRNNSVGSTNIQVKCLPHATAAGGIALVSTRRFSVQTVEQPTSLANVNLTAESDGTVGNNYKTLYGEFAMIVEPNLDFLTEVGDGNMSVEFPVNTGSVGAVYSLVQTDAATTAPLLQAAMDAGTAGLSGFTNRVFPLNIGFNTGGQDEAMLMASNYRFFVKDATQVRVFAYDNTEYDANTTAGASNENYTTGIRVKGKADATATLTDDNLDSTVTSINTTTGTTGVVAVDLSSEQNNTLMIYYNGAGETDASRAGTIDIQEWASGYDVLREQYPENESNESAKGALARVWQISTIVEAQNDMNDSGTYSGNYGSVSPDVADLRFNAFYAENFPVDGPLYEMKSELGVKAESIITGQTDTTGSYISWKQIDVSKPTDEWYDTDDQYELFWTEKEKGYWIWIDGTATNDLSIATPTITGSTYAHFNNKFQGSATTANTTNHLNKALTVNVSNLMDGGANANTDAYEVYANIAGVMTSFERDGATNDFSVLLNSHETNGIAFDEGQVTITITAAEGSGKKTSTTYLLDYSKPVISGVAVDGSEVTVSVTNADATEFHVYSGDINDSSYGSVGTTNWAEKFTLDAEDTVLNLGTVSSLTFPTQFESNSSAYLDPETALDSVDEQITEGVIRDVRIVAKDDAALFSNQQRLYYIPWQSGTGVLSDSSTLGDSTYDSGPVVYTATGDVNATYDGTINDGVQLSANGDAITCVYPHEDISYTEGTGESRLLVTSSGATIGSVIYAPSMAEKPLICQTGGNTYVTGFAKPGEAAPNTDRLIMVPLSSNVSVTLTKTVAP